MPKIQTYDNMTVDLMQATEYPNEMIAIAQSITMNSKDDEVPPQMTAKKIKFLLDAEHHSLLEHVVYTFLIQGVSRSFLAQITRQRTASPTSGSQHYQDYTDYPCAVKDPSNTIIQESLDRSYKAYELLLTQGVEKEEARQVLPNAACVNYLWTIDARNLMYFLKMRCCNRNVLEMRIFANKVHAMVSQHFPNLFDQVGPQCFSEGCKQGFMACKQGFWERV